MAKDLTKISTDKVLEDVFKRHREKFEYLLNEVKKLKDPGNPGIYTLAAFLIEIQEIEFHLIILITELGSAVAIKNGKKESKKEPFDMTLGEMKDEICKFEGDFLCELINSLSELNKLRRRYAHHLFSGIDAWDKVMEDVRRGIRLKTQVMSDLYRVSQYISKNTEYGKLMHRKLKE